MLSVFYMPLYQDNDNALYDNFHTSTTDSPLFSSILRFPITTRQYIELPQTHIFKVITLFPVYLKFEDDFLSILNLLKMVVCGRFIKFKAQWWCRPYSLIRKNTIIFSSSRKKSVCYIWILGYPLETTTLECLSKGNS